MNLDSFKRIIQDYLDGRLTNQGKDRVDAWYQSISNDDLTPFRDVDHKDAVRNEIFAKIGIDVPHKVIKNGQIKRFPWLSSAAAVLLLGIGSMMYFQYSKSTLYAGREQETALLTQVTTHAGQLQEIQLPDGTSIFLNGNTQVRYDKTNFATKRKLFLDRGEAFFQVKRDTAHPFTIGTGKVSVAVLGTSFNVNNSPTSQQISVEVKTGRVRVENEDRGDSHILIPGKGVRYKSGKGVEVFDRSPDHVNLWTQGGMLLDNVGFSELKEIIYNRYGLLLVGEGLATETFNYSLMIPRVQSLEQVLNIICNIHQIKFRRKNNEIILYK